MFHSFKEGELQEQRAKKKRLADDTIPTDDLLESLMGLGTVASVALGLAIRKFGSEGVGGPKVDSKEG